MRRPRPDEVCNGEQRFLFSNDRMEVWEPDLARPRYRWYRTRLKAIMRAIRDFGSGRRVLDLGCAQANLAILLAEEGFAVTAVDLNFEFLRYARLKVEKGDICFVAANAAAPPFKPVFDVVVLGELLEHCAHPGRILKTAASLLKPEGKGVIVITTPHGGFLGNRLPTYSRIKNRAVLEKNQFKPDADGHLFLLTVPELLGLAREVGLAVEDTRRYGTPLVTGHLKLNWAVARIRSKLNNYVFSVDTLLSRMPLLTQFFTEGILMVLRPEVKTPPDSMKPS